MRIVAYGLPPIQAALCAGLALLFAAAGEARAADADQPTVSFSHSGPGTVSAGWAENANLQSGESVPRGTTVTFTAIPDHSQFTNREFLAWHADCAPFGEPCALRITANATVRAEFGAPDVRDGNFFIAAQQGQADEVTRLLNERANINQRFPRGGFPGSAPLHAAVINGHTEVVSILIARGAFLNAQERDPESRSPHNTPLHLAARRGDRPEIAQMLIAAGANLNLRDRDGKTPLGLAVGLNSARAAIVPLLLKSGANHGQECQSPMVANPFSNAPPCRTCPGPLSPTDGACACPAGLVETGATGSDYGVCAPPPVTVAFSHSGGGALSVAWAGNPDLQNGETAPRGTTVTFTALPDAGRIVSSWSGDCKGRSGTVCPVTASVNVSVGVAFACGPYAEGLALGKAEDVRCNLDEGASPNDPLPNNDFRPLYQAVFGVGGAGTSLVVSLLLARGADPNITDVSGNTPLHYAAGDGRLGLIRLLLDGGADANRKNNDDKTPLRFASDGGHANAARLLIERGANHGTECAAPERANPLSHDPPCIGPRTVSLSFSGMGTVRISRAENDDLQSGETVPYAATVTFTATPLLDGHGPTWGGDCAAAGTAPTCVRTATVNLVASVVFADINECQIGGGGGAHNCQRAAWCVNRDPLADAGARFACACPPNLARPDGGCAAGGAVAFSASGEGTLSAAWGENPNLQSGALLPLDATVTFTALPAVGSELSEWRGDCAGTSGLQCAATVAAGGISVGVVFSCMDYARAVLDENLPVMECNFRAGQDPNGRLDGGRPPGLHLAAQRGLTLAVSLLLARGADPNLSYVANRGLRALHYAAGDGRLEVVLLLAAAGADLNTPDRGGRTPLRYAVSGEDKHYETARRMIALGAHYGTECGPPEQVNPLAADPPCVGPRTVSLSASGRGTVSAAWAGDDDLQSGETVPYAATVTFTATTLLAGHGPTWSGDCAAAGTATICVRTAIENLAVTAVFADINECLIPEQAPDCGRFSGCVNLDPAAVAGARFTCMCRPTFVSYAGGGRGCGCPPGRALRGDACVDGVAARFSHSGRGTVSAGWAENPNLRSGEAVATGATVTFTATPLLAGHGPTWSGDCAAAGTAPTCVRTADSPLNVTVIFADIDECQISGGGGGENAHDCAANMRCVNSDPQTADGARFSCVCGDGLAMLRGECVAGGTVSFFPSGHGVISAGWDENPNLQSGETAPLGVTVTFTVAPTPGGQFAAWVDACLGETTETCALEITGDTRVGAVFRDCPDFFMAAVNNDLAGVKCHLDSGTSANLQPRHLPGVGGVGRTALYSAVFHMHEALAVFLLEAGAGPNVVLNPATDREAPLHAATRNGGASMVRALLENGANPNLVNGRNGGETPLLLAVNGRNLETEAGPRAERDEIVRLLFAEGARYETECAGLQAVNLEKTDPPCVEPWSVSLSFSGGGTISVSWAENDDLQSGGLVRHRATVTFTAVPALEGHGPTWSGDCAAAGTALTCVRAATVNLTVAAVFADIDECARATHDCDTAARMLCTNKDPLVDAGERFSCGCEGGLSPSPRGICPLAVTVRLFYAAVNGTLSVAWAGNADLRSGDLVPVGASVTFTAIPAPGFAVSWTGDCPVNSGLECVLPAGDAPGELRVGATFACVELTQAIFDRNLPGIQCHLDAGLDPNTTFLGRGGLPALHFVVGVGGAPLIAELLLRANADPNLPSSNGTALAIAFAGRNRVMMALLIENGAHYGTPCPAGDRVNPESDSPPCVGPRTVNLRQGAGGTVRARSGGDEIQSGDAVPYRAVVTFTATPYPGRKWAGWNSGHGCDRQGRICALRIVTHVTVHPSFRQCENFHLAALANRLDEIKCHVDSGSDLNPRDARTDPRFNGHTPLYFAVQFGNYEIAATLLAAGADPNLARVPGEDEETALHEAARDGRVRMVRLLTENGARPNDFVNAADETPLNLAIARVSGGSASADDREIVRLLIAAGAHHGQPCVPPDVVNPDRTLPPCRVRIFVRFPAPEGGKIAAAAPGRPNLQDGGHVSYGDRVTFTAIPNPGRQLTIWTGDCDGETSLVCEVAAVPALEDDQRVSVGAEFSECPDFHDSAGANHLIGVKCHLDSGSDLDSRENGKNPLHLAAAAGHAAIVAAMLEAGANPNSADADGKTPLNLAVERPNRPPDPDDDRVVRMIVAAGGHHGTPCETPRTANPSAAEPPCLEGRVVSLSFSGLGRVSAAWAGDPDLQSGEKVPRGVSITFTATPLPGHRFAAWSGHCAASGSDPICARRATVDLTVGATFADIDECAAQADDCPANALCQNKDPLASSGQFFACSCESGFMETEGLCPPTRIKITHDYLTENCPVDAVPYYNSAGAPAEGHVLSQCVDCGVYTPRFENYQGQVFNADGQRIARYFDDFRNCNLALSCARMGGVPRDGNYFNRSPENCAEPAYPLAVRAVPAAGGTVVANGIRPGRGALFGVTVTFSARVADGWEFTRWEGACLGQNDPGACEVRVENPVDARALFTDIDECAVDANICAANPLSQCVNYPGRFACECLDGHSADPDGICRPGYVVAHSPVAAGAGGTVSARLKDGEALAAVARVSVGATVVFTAHPDANHHIRLWLEEADELTALTHCALGRAATECEIRASRNLRVRVDFARIPGTRRLVTPADLADQACRGFGYDVVDNDGVKIGEGCVYDPLGNAFTGEVCYALDEEHAATPRSQLNILDENFETSNVSWVRKMQSCDEHLFCARRGIEPRDGDWFNQHPSNCPLFPVAVRLFQSDNGRLSLLAADGRTKIGAAAGGETDILSTVVFRATPDAGHHIAEWRGVDACPSGLGMRKATDCAVQVRRALRVSVVFAPNPSPRCEDHPGGCLVIRAPVAPGAGGTVSARIKDGVRLLPVGRVSVGSTIVFTAHPAPNHHIRLWLDESDDALAALARCPFGRAVTVATECEFVADRELLLRVDFARIPGSARVVTPAHLRGNCNKDRIKPADNPVAQFIELENAAGEVIGAVCAFTGFFNRVPLTVQNCYALSDEHIGTPRDAFASRFALAENCDEILLCAARGIAPRDGNYFNQSPSNCPLFPAAVRVSQSDNGRLGVFAADGETAIGAGEGGAVELLSTVVFRATPDAGYHIGEWRGVSGCPVGSRTWSGADCAVQVAGPLHVSVVFAANPSSVAVSYSGSSGGTLRARDAAGGDLAVGGMVAFRSTVTFTATPDPGYHAAEWSGIGAAECDAGLSAALAVSCGVLADADLAVAVAFRVSPRRVSFSAGANGGGTVIAQDASGMTLTVGDLVSVGATVTFTALPDAEHYVSEWQGLDDSSCDSGPAAIGPTDCLATTRFNEDLAVSALFALRPRETVSLYHSSGGTLSARDFLGRTIPAEDGTVLSGSTVTFTATPDAAYYLAEWHGAADGAGCAAGLAARAATTCEVRATTAVSVSVSFVVSPGLSFSWGANGTLSAHDADGNELESGALLEPGATVTLSALPDAGYYVAEWSGIGEAECDAGVSFTAATRCPVVIVSAEKVAVVFRALPRRVVFSAGADGGGTVAAQDAGGTALTSGDSVAVGVTVTFTALPDAEHYVSEWQGLDDSSCDSGPAAIGPTDCLATTRVNEDLAISALFALRPRETVSLYHSPGGTLSARDFLGRTIPAGNGTALSGSTVTFTATPDAAYYLAEWHGAADGVGCAAGRTTTAETICEVRATAAVSVSVSFASLSPTLSFSWGANGTLSAHDADGNALQNGAPLEPGATVTFKALPDSDYRILEWRGIGDAVCAAGLSTTGPTECPALVESDLRVSVSFAKTPGRLMIEEIEKPLGEADAATVRAHLLAGADADRLGGTDNLPALILAGRNGHAGIVSVLVTSGANPDATDADGRNMIFYLAVNGMESAGDSPALSWAAARTVALHFASALSLSAVNFDWLAVDSENRRALDHLSFRYENWLTDAAERADAAALGDVLYWQSRAADGADAESQCGAAYAASEALRFSRICLGPAVVPSAAREFGASLVLSGSRTTITLGWSAPLANDWRVTGYVVRRVEADAPSAGSCAGAAYPAFAAALRTPGENARGMLDAVGEEGYGGCFKYQIAARNAAGEGAAAESAGVYVQGLPDAPFGLSAATLESGAVSLAWSAPLTLRGGVIEGYEVWRGLEGSEAVSIGFAAGATTYLDAEPPKGSMLRYHVRTRSGAGVGPFSRGARVETARAVRDAVADDAVSPSARDARVFAAAGYFGFGYAIPVAADYRLIQEEHSGLDYDLEAEAIWIREDNPVRSGSDLVLAVTALAVCDDCNPAGLTVTVRFSPVSDPGQAVLTAAYDSDFSHGVVLPSGYESGGTLTILSDDGGGFALDEVSGVTLVRRAGVVLAEGDYGVSLGFTRGDFLGTVALEVSAMIGPDCLEEEERLADGENPLLCGDCRLGYGDLNGYCVPRDDDMPDDRRACEDILEGRYMAIAGGAGAICSRVDINDTFCIVGSVEAFPCAGLFNHIRDCNLKHNRPALDPFHCAGVCASDRRAVGDECVPAPGEN